MQVAFEGPCLVCRAGNSKIIKLVSLPRIDCIIAMKVQRPFSDILDAIIEVGSLAMLLGEKFYVKAIRTSSADYVERNVDCFHRRAC